MFQNCPNEQHKDIYDESQSHFHASSRSKLESSVSVLKWIAAHATEHAVKISSYTAHVSHE